MLLYRAYAAAIFFPCHPTYGVLLYSMIVALCTLYSLVPAHNQSYYYNNKDRQSKQGSLTVHVSHHKSGGDYYHMSSLTDVL